MNKHHNQLRLPITPFLSAIFLLVLPILSACDSPGAGTPTPEATPADLSVTYEYRAGTMPPPFHDEYAVVIGPGNRGHIVYHPDYPSETTPTWTEVLTPTTAQLDDLYALLKSNNLLRENWNALGDPPVGGSAEWATITANGKVYSIPPALSLTDSQGPEALYEFVTKSLVPQSVWDRLEAQRTQYQEEYEKLHP